MATYSIEQATLSAIADTIRARRGTSSTMTPEEMPQEIAQIEAGAQAVVQEKTVRPGAEGQTVRPDTGYDALSAVYITGDSDLAAQNIRSGVNIFGVTGEYEGEAPVLQEKTVTPGEEAQTVTPDSGYDGLSQVTVNAMPEAAQATPVISVSGEGLITASAAQAAGYVAAGTKSAAKQLDTQAAKTVTPGTGDQTAVAGGRYTTGAVTVRGDANLLAENIRSGVTIFDVLGSYAGEGGGGSSGGLPSGVSALASGTFTPTEDYTAGADIEHGLGVVPNFFVWILQEDVSASTVSSLAVFGAFIRKKVRYSASVATSHEFSYYLSGYTASGSMSATYSRVNGTSYMNESTCKLFSTSTHMLLTGHSYRWVAGVMDDIA